MTLILTYINKSGIIHASDTNITYRSRISGQKTGVEQHSKLFKIDHLDAALTIAGSYTVGGQSMDKWMPLFIQSQLGTTLSEFSHNLGNRLQSQMSTKEKSDGSFVHIAGYVKEVEESHPEFWFVRNIGGIDTNGYYKNFQAEFMVEEQLLGRDYSKYDLAKAFEQGGWHMYINGFPPGRIVYMQLIHQLNESFKIIWNNPNWPFKPPSTLKETEAFVKLRMQFIATLFQSTKNDEQTIGGEIETLSIPNPDVD